MVRLNYLPNLLAVLSAESTRYIDDLSQLISETITAYNQRSKGTSSGKKPEENLDIL